MFCFYDICNSTDILYIMNIKYDTANVYNTDKEYNKINTIKPKDVERVIIYCDYLHILGLYL